MPQQTAYRSGGHPRTSQPPHALGFALCAQGQYDEARATFRALYSDTRSHRSLHNLIMVEREAGCYPQALELVAQERAMLSADDLAWAANLYEESLVLEHLGDHTKAAAAAQSCLKHSERAADVVMLGCAWRLLGDVTRHSDPTQAKAHYRQAQSYFQSLEDEKALEELRERYQELEARA